MIYQNNKIELTEDGNYRPNSLIINDEVATMENFSLIHGWNWESTASGNYLYYCTESGKEYCIPQKKLWKMGKSA